LLEELFDVEIHQLLGVLARISTTLSSSDGHDDRKQRAR
jgi:hypothetical protein